MTVTASDTITPMMAQYLDIKAAHPGCLLFYRMGDFYELFFSDAREAAAALDIALTRRGRHQGQDIPMCGVPVHAAEAYLEKLIRRGFKVAICEQTEDPAEARKSKRSVVRREVVRLVTAGTLTEETLLEARAHHWLAAINLTRNGAALAAVDLSTGDCFTEALGSGRLAAELARLAPREILIPDREEVDPDIAAAVSGLGAAPVQTFLPAMRFDAQAGERRLKAIFAIGALDAFGSFERAEIGALAALIDYVELTQKGRLPFLKAPKRIAADHIMAIDAATRRNLELTRALSGEMSGTLLSSIDRTLTGAGARLLEQRVSAPLTDPGAIDQRLDGIEYFRNDAMARAAIRAALRRLPDVARSLSRLSLGRGGPRDLGALRDGLAQGENLRAALSPRAELQEPPEAIVSARNALTGFDALIGELARMLADEPPLQLRDGGFIRPGCDPALDDFRQLSEHSRQVVAGLEKRYRDETAIAALKIRHNNILGYHIEVSAVQAEKLTAGPLKERFIHRQTMAGAMRFTTTELADLASRIEQAAGGALAREMELFRVLTERVLAEAAPILAAAEAAAALDVAAGLAELAAGEDWVRPVLDSSLAFEIEAGRHPVVEAGLKAAGEGRFIANDCDLSADRAGARRLWLVTGPNMAGKSTFLRQNALIAILAQAGSYVPARRARIGCIDRLFSRVGAADDLARGRSTFMVEMVETAAILNQAGTRSLVILDEIGRGTATFDGLSIAWAAAEHLHDINRCRALFATHYHELTALSGRLDGVANHTMKVKDWNDEIVFLHEVAAGVADRSYGIHVAKLAGLPKPVIARAEQVLEALERGDVAKRRAGLVEELPLFAAAPPKPEARPDPALEALRALDPDNLSPKEALEALYRLRGLLPAP